MPSPSELRRHHQRSVIRVDVDEPARSTVGHACLPGDVLGIARGVPDEAGEFDVTEVLSAADASAFRLIIMVEQVHTSPPSHQRAEVRAEEFLCPTEAPRSAPRRRRRRRRRRACATSPEEHGWIPGRSRVLPMEHRTDERTMGHRSDERNPAKPRCLQLAGPITPMARDVGTIASSDPPVTHFCTLSTALPSRGSITQRNSQ